MTRSASAAGCTGHSKWRAVASWTRARGVAHVRHRRRRTHRSRAGRADPGNGHAGTGQRVPQHRARRRTGAALRRGKCVLGGFAPDLTAHGGARHRRPTQRGHRHPEGGGPPEEYAARTILWTAGVEAVPFARHVAEVFGATSDRAGRIAVERGLSVPGHPEIFVIGDLVGRDHLPGVAENAMQGGLHAADCVRRDLAGKARRPYGYRDLGSAAYICRGHALLQAGPVKLAGFFGWLGWGLIHIAFRRGESHQHRRHMAGHDRARPPHRPNVHSW